MESRGLGARHDMTEGSLDPASYDAVFVRRRRFAEKGYDRAPRNRELREQDSLAVVSAEPIVVHE